MLQPRRNRFGLDHYASSLGLICACRQQGNEGKWGEGQGKGESSLDLFSLAFCLFGFVLILFSRPLPAQICNRRNASLDMSSDLEAGLINWLHWTRRTSHEKWNSFKFRLPCLPMNLSSQVEQTIKWHFYLQNQTRPDETQATRPNQERERRLNAHPHVTKIYKTLTLIACGVVFGLHETKIQAGKKATSIRRKRKGRNTIRITGTLEWVQAWWVTYGKKWTPTGWYMGRPWDEL